jgi:hypothetical protein
MSLHLHRMSLHPGLGITIGHRMAVRTRGDRSIPGGKPERWARPRARGRRASAESACHAGGTGPRRRHPRRMDHRARVRGRRATRRPDDRRPATGPVRRRPRAHRARRARTAHHSSPEHATLTRDELHNSYGESFVKGVTPDARGCGGHLCRSGGGGLAWVRDARSDSYARVHGLATVSAGPGFVVRARCLKIEHGPRARLAHG